VLVAGVDSSTQACKVVVRDAETGVPVREGRAPHPAGTEIDPRAWWEALQQAFVAAGGIDDVASIAVAGQQHGMVCVDEHGRVVRPALLWNDTRSAAAAGDLVRELGAGCWAEAVGSVPVASFTVTKLRWLACAEPQHATRTAAVCLPHDWLTWRLRNTTDIDALTTDRGDASGTGYWSPATSSYRRDLLVRALGSDVVVPDVLEPAAASGYTPTGAVVAAGTGDNMAGALGVDARRGDVIVSVGTSGVVCVVSDRHTADLSGNVAGFADAAGGFLPLVCTLNGTGVLDATARLLGVDHATLSDLALSAPPGSGGLVFVPYLAGERTPNVPGASGELHGMRERNTTPAHLARAAVEGLLCGLRDGIAAIEAQGTPVERVRLIGGGARSEAVRSIAPAVFGRPVLVPEPGEYVAQGAARQAAWAVAGGVAPPEWDELPPRAYEAAATPAVVEQYRVARDRVVAAQDREDVNRNERPRSDD
jgi:xylulokinase